MMNKINEYKTRFSCACMFICQRVFYTGKVASFKELTGGVEFRQEIPKSASGKILRRQLKEELKK